MKNVEYAGQLHPLVVTKTSELVSSSAIAKLKILGTMIFGGACIAGLLVLIGTMFSLGWLVTIGYVSAPVLLLLGIYFAVSAKSADCPACNQLLESNIDQPIAQNDENQVIECSSCFETLVSNAGTIRMLTPQDDFLEGKFQAPVFRNGVWPNECICCGGVVDHVEEAKKTKVELTKLLVGTLSVGSTSVDGIPYCNQHGEMVSITIEDEHPRLIFGDLGARRRYVMMNRGKEAVKLS